MTGRQTDDEFQGELMNRPHKEDVYWWIAEAVFLGALIWLFFATRQ